MFWVCVNFRASSVDCVVVNNAAILIKKNIFEFTDEVF